MLPHVDTDSSTSNLVAQKLQGTAPPATPTSMMRPALRVVAMARAIVASLPTRSRVRSAPRPWVRSWIA